VLFILPFIIGGNPTTDFHIERAAGDLLSADAIVDHVKYTSCVGGTSAFVAVDQSLDLVNGHLRIATPVGNWCSVTVFWEGSVTIDGAGYTLSYDQLATTMQLGSNGYASSDLAPFTVVAGQFPVGTGAPKLVTTIQ
jgi:hypothetical protein